MIPLKRSEWGEKSTVTVSDLPLLKAHYNIPDSCTLHVQSEGEFYDSPKGENRWALSVETFRQGFRLPANAFINDLLKAYKVAPSQLTPNAWGTLTVFQVAWACVGLPSSVPLFKRFHRIFPLRCAWCISVDGIRFLQDPLIKNDTARWLQPWFLVENGFAPEVPRQYTTERIKPKFSYTEAEKEDHQKMIDFFETNRLSFACVLSERVLAKAKISSGNAPQESFGKFFLLPLYSRCFE